MTYAKTAYPRTDEAQKLEHDFKLFRARLKQNVKLESLKQWTKSKNLKQD